MYSTGLLHTSLLLVALRKALRLTRMPQAPARVALREPVSTHWSVGPCRVRRRRDCLEYINEHLLLLMLGFYAEAPTEQDLLHYSPLDAA